MMSFVNKSNAEYAEGIQYVHQLFERQCIESANETAIQFGNDSLTYDALNERSGNLSLAILAKFPNEPIIAISATRNIEMIIGVLAILKAGKAYLPFDTNFPNNRLLDIITDAGIRACVSVEQEKIYFENLGLQVLTSDFRYKIQPLPGVVQGSLAYTLYTSGSTGKPKGVCMGHKSLVNLLKWQNANSKATNRSPTLQFAPLSFDVSFQEIFATLTSGGVLVLINDDVRLDPHHLLRCIKNSSIQRLFLPFVALQQLAEVAVANNFFPESLLEILAAGEQLKITPQIIHFFSNLPECCLYNQYGPTEAHVVTALKLDGNPSHWPSLPSIGKGIDQTQIFIVDEALQPLPVGNSGELLISGLAVAEGYLNNEKLTKEKFINWNHSDKGLVRIYRTGDLGRYLPDGNIEFLGRKDDQVKIRGHRVELGEIEVALNMLPGIQQAVVTVREDNQGQKSLIAYLVCSDHKKDTPAIRQSLQKILPDFMVPAAFVWVDNLPKTSTGKVDKKALPKPDNKRPDISSLYKAPRTEIEKRMVSLWCRMLQLNSIGTEDDFFELGGNSLLAVKTVVELKQLHNYDLPVTRLYQHPNIKSIASYFEKNPNMAVKNSTSKKNLTDVAVIGMAGRFPGADTIEQLWDLLKEGKETIRFFGDDELHYTIPETLKKDPSYVKARGIINDADKFDAAFFGINPAVATLMDPQQRIFLEIAWEVLEQTGHLPATYNGSIGVFAGCGNNSYYLNNVLSNTELIDKVGSFQVMTVNEKDYIASRVAYQLNLKGPAVSVYSGCSTSLLAIAQAVESIRNGKCKLALAGGVAIHAPINSGQYYEEGAMFSPDGHCKPFDKDAKGTVFSDGAGIVLLKNLEDAIHDNDTIYAILKGIGINNDGADKSSFTAPSAEGQAGAIVEAMNDAGIEPLTVGYIETHGTATPLGDPIEIHGLELAFGPQKRSQFCAIGSLKSNLGHLTAAAGVAGFIKTALSLYHKQLPASLHYKEPNPNIQFSNTPFFVNTTFTNWNSDQVRRAGVSSFGVGGTNVHIVLQEFENVIKEPGKTKPFTLVSWSAKTENSRSHYGEMLKLHSEKNPEQNIADLAYTLHTTRPSFNFRRFIIASDHGNLRDGLIHSSNPAMSKTLQEKTDEIAFLFPGQGSQYTNMGLDLYLQESVFKNAVDECAVLVQSEMNEDIRLVLYPTDKRAESSPLLNNTLYTQPALFITEYALAKLWMSWGITPSVLAGHSIGEFVAAHLAGIFSLQDALKLVVSRSTLMNNVGQGKMLSVQASEADLESMLPASLSLAAVNSSKTCVVSGDIKTIESFAAELKSKGVACLLLNTSHGFHSSMMNGIVKPFKEIVQTIILNQPKIPIVSTVTGTWMSDAEATDPAYWANQLRATVRFADALDTLYADQKRILLEVGPGSVTAMLARYQLRARSVTAIAGLSNINKAQSEYYSILESLGQLWLHGMEPDWKSFYSNQERNKIVLPAYSFDKKRFWVEPFNKEASSIPLEAIKIFDVKATENPLPQKNSMRKEMLISEIKQILEDASGLEMHSMPSDIHFMEMGLDSLSLTQISLSLKKKFSIPITFRQLMEEHNTVNTLVNFIDGELPAEKYQPVIAGHKPSPDQQEVSVASVIPTLQNDTVLSLLSEQIQLLAKQVNLLQSGNINEKPLHIANPIQESELSKEEETEIKKPFGATARIQKQSETLHGTQQKFIKNFIQKYNDKTSKSKVYTQKYRSTMADPRVVSGFHPLIKEMIYPIVVNRSKGCRLWDIDGNEYIDALNGFGSNLLGYQNEWVKKAVQLQIDNGYEIGPQHELAGEVCSLICEFTNFDRAALCNTGSEAVLGALRIARTVTGRSLIVSFNGSYHGIADEVLVRGTKKLKSYPAAPGILPEAVQNILVLDYGTEESLKIIKERAHELAAVLVEPIQSRRPEFVPVGFLKELRNITESSGTALIFDEVITGFRMHPGGVQALFNIKADIGTYGKVVAGGMPIGVIAGNKKFMDSLDGGSWRYGDDSIPEVGVTYFAGTFVRHPLALAAAKATLEYMKIKGPSLQENISAKTKYLADTLNGICEQLSLPLFIAQFGSLWKFKFKNELPYSETLFSLLRHKGIHIWDLFPCFITEAHSDDDINTIIVKFRESVHELIDAKIFSSFLKNDNKPANNKFDEEPPVPGSKLGKDAMGNPAWFMLDPDRPGKFLQIEFNEN